MNVQLYIYIHMLSARQLGIARPRFIKSSEIMSRQPTVGSLLLSVAAGRVFFSGYA